MKLDKIVILGGGSAGWMSAATMIKAFPDKDISVIESPDVPTVGVGESTLGQIRRWTRYIGLDEDDFMPYTDATYKLSIQFTDFYKEDSGPFHYPFGEPYREGEGDLPFMNWWAMRENMPDLSEPSLVDLTFPSQKLWSNNRWWPKEDGDFFNFDTENAISYHFDAAKFGLWLRERYCIPRGVKWIPKHMEKAVVNEDGISHLVMSDGEEIYADLFIDCTGFKSLLLGGALEEPFVSYKDILPNDSAWATQVPYKDKYVEMKSYTDGTAISNGWVWDIPLWSRIGKGYVYSSQYVSDEDALEEFKAHLQSDRMLIPRTKAEVEELTFRNIKMRVGIHERVFVKNVAAIGLSAGFIEPLESNGLFSVHEFLIRLIPILSRGTVNEFDRLMYNNESVDIFDGFAKFVAIHYAMSARTDTKYWRDNANRMFSEERGGKYMDRTERRSSTFYSAQRKFYDKFQINYDTYIDGIFYISAGMGYRPMFGTDMSDFRYKNSNFDNDIDIIYNKWLEREKGWEEKALQAPHIVDYLRDKYHNKG